MVTNEPINTRSHDYLRWGTERDSLVTMILWQIIYINSKSVILGPGTTLDNAKTLCVVKSQVTPCKQIDSLIGQSIARQTTDDGFDPDERNTHLRGRDAQRAATRAWHVAEGQRRFLPGHLL